MKTLKTLLFATALLSLFASCNSSSSQTRVLSNQETRKEIMGTIANDSTMSKEMIETMMNNENGSMMMYNQQMMMIQDHGSMMKMLKDNPNMMQNMMSGMIETTKGDSLRMSEMINKMMQNPQMRQMMQNRTGSNGMMQKNKDNNNMNNMGNRKGMNH